MDWDRAISRNSEAITAIVAALFALLLSARLPGCGLMVRRHVWRSVLFVLRPAEAAVRRLIILAARSLAAAAFSPRRGAAGAPSLPRCEGAVQAPLFHLFDSLKLFATGEDDGEGDGGQPALFSRDGDDLPVDAAHLHDRLRALRLALADLPRQARRLARCKARRNALLAAFRPARLSPMRPGLPPGWRERARHAIDPVLKECHRLALDLVNTS